jgi:alkylation response protein AidB-like acyl-CoA dehydrogenase
MDFSFTEEQSMLRDSVASYLADHYDFDMRRAAVKSAAGWRPEVWKAFAEDLGISWARRFPRTWAAWAAGPPRPWW